MQDWVKVLVSAVAAAFLGAAANALRQIWQRHRQQAVRQSAVEEGVKALLHDRLCEACTGVLEKKEAAVSEIENIEFLYRPYVALGGNGTARQLYERVTNLPIESEEPLPREVHSDRSGTR